MALIIGFHTKHILNPLGMHFNAAKVSLMALLLTNKLQMVSNFQPDFKAAVLCEFISILDFLELSHTWAKLSCRLVLEFLSGTVNRIDFYI